MKFDPGFLKKVLLAYYFYKFKNRRIRSMYVRPIFLKRNVLGESILTHELGLEDPEYHHKYFRMNKEQFDYILKKIENQIFHSITHARPIAPHDRLAITLRYLATGCKQVYLALNYRISPASVCNILKETMAAICKNLSEYLPEPSRTDWHTIAGQFEAKWNFVNCCGAIDGKHIRIKAPRNSGSVYYNYKSFFSVVLLAIATADYRFSVVDIGTPGSISDGGILKRSSVGVQMERQTLNLPPAKRMENGSVIPPVFVGDDAFPLKPYLLKPFAGRNRHELNLSQKIFNYRLSRARMVVENTFGIFAARWRIFETPIDAEPDTVVLITTTCVILHNFLASSGNLCGITADHEENGIVVPGSWRSTVEDDKGLVTIPQQGSNNAATEAFKIRDDVMHYFVSMEGQVPWQNESALRGYE